MSMRDLRRAHDRHDQHADHGQDTKPHGPVLALTEFEELLHERLRYILFSIVVRILQPAGASFLPPGTSKLMPEA